MEIVAQVDLAVFENNDKTLPLRLKQAQPDGSTLPYLLDGSPTIELYVKVSPDDSDASPKFKYSTATGEIIITADGSAPGATYSEIKVTTHASDQTPPGTYYYHLDVIKSSKRDTVAARRWFILNT